ncbi:MAG: AraC family transcriptional regulator [Lutibacter sp.]|nr:AraC family transcriptional regulator [Lutibacter sp.]
MKLNIKNMVSNTCKTLVKKELKKLGLHFIVVDLGEIDVMEDISEEQRNQLKIDLSQFGLELLDDKRIVLIEKIKNLIIEMIQNSDETIKIKFSIFLSEKLHHNYTYLANLFSEVQGISIQQFIILHKIERVKELMFYDELNIKEIAYRLNYSSVAHLSNQFKKVTGLSPGHFRQMKDNMRRPLEDVGNRSNNIKKAEIFN